MIISSHKREFQQEKKNILSCMWNGHIHDTFFSKYFINNNDTSSRLIKKIIYIYIFVYLCRYICVDKMKRISLAIENIFNLKRQENKNSNIDSNTLLSREPLFIK